MAVDTTIALKLHAFGLTQLHDPNWTGVEMYYHLGDHMKHRVEPYDILYKTLKKGLLYHIGVWLFEDFFFADTYRMGLGGEYRLWYLEDLTNMLVKSEQKGKFLTEAVASVERISALYDINNQQYFRESKSTKLFGLIENVITEHDPFLRQIAPEYAENYAERVFHDRQLCEHICKTLIVIGFDGTNGNGDPPKQWIDRQAWPSWAVKAVTARDRGVCASCGASLTLELAADTHVDHIIPLAKGGTNDLANLQLSCDDCNLKKSSKLIDVQSSIPPYLQVRRTKKSQKSGAAKSSSRYSSSVRNLRPDLSS